MKNTKKKLTEMIEWFGMGVDYLINEGEEIFTFTTCDMKDCLKIKNFLDKIELGYEEEFEIDGGDPYFMIEVEANKLRELIK